MRTRAILLIPAVGIAIVLFVFVVFQPRPGQGRVDLVQPDTVLPAEDAARMGVQVRPVDPAIDLGLIPRDQALRSAAARWESEPARPEPFLQRMTDPDTFRSDHPLRDSPVWVVRYSGLRVESPGGRELHYAYVVIDARTGVELHTNWAP